MHRINNFNSKEIDYLWDKYDIGLAFIDKDGNWLRVNAACCAVLEYTAAELSRRKFQDITHPDDVGDDVEMTKKVISGDIDWYPMTKRYITKTGKVIWVKLTVNAVRDENNDFVCFFAQIFPIDPDLLISRTTMRATSAVRNQRFSIDSVGKYLAANWMWISPISAGVSYFLWKSWTVLWEIIILWTSSHPPTN